jgi:uncharacterized membrane protein
VARSPLPTHSASARRTPGTATPADRAIEPEPAPPAPALAGRTPPRAWIALAISAAAFGISVYLTLAHYDSSAVSLVCSGHGAINCAKVTTSPQSMVFGIFPVALLGLLFYTGVLVLNLPQLWRSPWRFVAPLRVAAMVVGMGFVLYLITVEAQLRAICVWCTAVHILTFALFMLVVTGWEDATAARYEE